MTSELERLDGGDLLVVPSGRDWDMALVFGQATLSDDFGAVGEVLPVEYAKRVADHLGIAAVAGTAFDPSKGQWVKLSAETVAQIKKHGLSTGADGSALGVIRDAQGKWAHVARFEAGNPLAIDPATFAAALAMQQIVRSIEQKLEGIAKDVQGLVRGERNKLEARLASSTDIIERVEANVLNSGLVSDDDWQSLAALESTVKEAYHQTVAWLAPLRAFLMDGELSLAEQVRLLTKEHGLRDADYWLRMHVHSELALKRWELLYLTRRSVLEPKAMTQDAKVIRRRAEERHTDLAGLVELIGLYLDDDGEDQHWTDRFRFLSRHRLERLRAELAQVANAYAAALDRAQVSVPAYIEILEPGPLFDLVEARKFVGESAMPALKAKSESFIGFGRLQAERVTKRVRRSSTPFAKDT